jgi:hypothetical protein
MLTNQRDEARKLYEEEYRAHVQCHETFEEILHQIRIQGYAEGIAAGLYPGKPFETLTEEVQETIMCQAGAGINKIDEIRSELKKPIIH